MCAVHGDSGVGDVDREGGGRGRMNREEGGWKWEPRLCPVAGVRDVRGPGTVPPRPAPCPSQPLPPDMPSGSRFATALPCLSSCPPGTRAVSPRRGR
jgi:hypothetical protein